jgi:hypothetical protein
MRNQETSRRHAHHAQSRPAPGLHPDSSDALDAHAVAQTSKSAVSPVSKPALRTTSNGLAIWKSAIRQAWKPALRGWEWRAPNTHEACSTQAKGVITFWLALFLAIPTGRATAGANETTAQPGISYTNIVDTDTPLSIHMIKIERNRRDLQLCTALGKDNVIGMDVVSGQIKALPGEFGEPLAAINGDFYDKKEKEEGRPRDLQVRFGEVVSSPAGHTCFWITPDGQPRMTNVFSKFRVIWPGGEATSIGLNQMREDNSAVLYTAAYGHSTRTSGGVELTLERQTNSAWLPLKVGERYEARVRAIASAGNAALGREVMVLSLGPELSQRVGNVQPGATIGISTETLPNLTGVDVAIGGGPSLVENGKAMHWTGLVKFRHPRTALGWNESCIFLVVVDGRQSDISIGMTFPELADFMVKIGCQEAMNLDGGGSATLWAFGKVRNSPSEGEERPAPNALVVLRKPPGKP